MEFVRPIFTVIFTVTDPRLFDTQNGAVTLELVITAYTVATDTPHISTFTTTLTYWVPTTETPFSKTKSGVWVSCRFRAFGPNWSHEIELKFGRASSSRVIPAPNRRRHATAVDGRNAVMRVKRPQWKRNFILLPSTLLPKTVTLSKQQATKLPVASTMLLRHCC